MGRRDIGKPFEFPASLSSSPASSYKSGANLTPSTPLTMLSVGTGNSGVVRSIMIATVISPADLLHTFLNIYYDGSSSATTTVPLAGLLGVENGASYSGSSVFTPFFGLGGQSSNPPQLVGGIRLSFPLPYTNGIVITLSTDNGLALSIWSNVEYQTSLPSCWNRNLRFWAVRSSASVPTMASKFGRISMTIGSQNVTGTSTTFDSTWVGKCAIGGNCTWQPVDDMYITAVTDATHLTISSTDVGQIILSGYTAGSGHALCSMHTFLSRSGKSGWLTGLNVGLLPASLGYTSMLEGNPRIFLNGGAEPSFTWSGSEDLPYGGFYWDGARTTGSTALTDSTAGTPGSTLAAVGGSLYATDIVTIRNWIASINAKLDTSVIRLVGTQDIYGGPTVKDGATGAVSFYRLFYDSPIRYQNAIVGKWPNLDELGAVTSSWTAYGYEEQ